ncbi:hypothetical protein BZG35_11810 [Brevundimonas sp. LM2]|uniref:hypothetical protein n=1 Tax=Brevundimonas sp. LM2 TaxID=1938605 RepID=UPI000983CC3E|nr:hypothetical protein [Brevundimonas sp. LM2]AQR62250.1 hypothetical protein BZG35_11810 [Brevundimonas sp. LM2]
MSHKDVHGRRLNLRVALAATAAAMPRLWIGAGGVLTLAVIIGASPLLLGAWSAPWAAGVAGILLLMATGALARLATTSDTAEARALGLGPSGFQIGWPELRLVGAALLSLIFLTMIVALLALVVLAIFGVAELDVAAIQARDWSAVGAPWKLGILAIVAVGAVMIPLLLAVRLSLFVPATLGRRQMVSLNSMGIAYGSFWQILGGLIVTGLPAIGLGLAGAMAALAGATGTIVTWIVLIGLQLPLTLGFLGAAYRRLEYWSPDVPLK